MKYNKKMKLSKNKIIIIRKTNIRIIWLKWNND